MTLKKDQMTTATLGMSFQSASDRDGALQARFDFKSDRGNTSVDILYRSFLRWRKGLTATTGPPDDASHFGLQEQRNRDYHLAEAHCASCLTIGSMVRGPSGRTMDGKASNAGR